MRTPTCTPMDRMWNSPAACFPRTRGAHLRRPHHPRRRGKGRLDMTPACSNQPGSVTAPHATRRRAPEESPPIPDRLAPRCANSSTNNRSMWRPAPDSAPGQQTPRPPLDSPHSILPSGDQASLVVPAGPTLVDEPLFVCRQIVRPPGYGSPSGAPKGDIPSRLEAWEGPGFGRADQDCPQIADGTLNAVLVHAGDKLEHQAVEGREGGLRRPRITAYSQAAKSGR